MRLLYDDRELIEYLKAENQRLTAQVEGLTSALDILKGSVRQLAESFRALAAQPKDSSRRLPIPDRLIDLVDWEKMGMQAPEVKR